MSPKRLDDQAICAAYEACDLTHTSVTEFCESNNLSKQSLYTVLRRNDVTPKSQRVTAGSVREILDDIRADIASILGILQDRPDQQTTTLPHADQQARRVVRRLVAIPHHTNGSAVS